MLIKEKFRKLMPICSILNITNKLRGTTMKEIFSGEHWHDYDENGNCIHKKTADGYEAWYEYD